MIVQGKKLTRKEKEQDQECRAVNVFQWITHESDCDKKYESYGPMAFFLLSLVLQKLLAPEPLNDSF